MALEQILDRVISDELFFKLCMPNKFQLGIARYHVANSYYGLF
jgi:hypothetical protein